MSTLFCIKTTNILKINLVGEYGWNLVRKVTWAEYLEYSKQVSGEGTNWKAEII